MAMLNYQRVPENMAQTWQLGLENEASDGLWFKIIVAGRVGTCHELLEHVRTTKYLLNVEYCLL